MIPLPEVYSQNDKFYDFVNLSVPTEGVRAKSAISPHVASTGSFAVCAIDKYTLQKLGSRTYAQDDDFVGEGVSRTFSLLPF